MNNEILIIDDELSTESTIRRFEFIHNLKMDWAKTPEDGLKLIKSKKYKVIILDIMMPLKNIDIFTEISSENEYGLVTGIVMLEKINNLAKNSKVIFCSARGEEIMTKYDDMYKRGVHYVEYFQKPYDSLELFEIINGLL